MLMMMMMMMMMIENDVGVKKKMGLASISFMHSFIHSFIHLPAAAVFELGVEHASPRANTLLNLVDCKVCLSTSTQPAAFAKGLELITSGGKKVYSIEDGRE